MADITASRVIMKFSECKSFIFTFNLQEFVWLTDDHNWLGIVGNLDHAFHVNLEIML